MSNENWNESESVHEVDPWDRGTYQTGSTTPPKSYGGAIAIGLVLAIFLLGVVSILAMMRISVFQAAENPEPDIHSHLNIQDPNPSKATAPSVRPTTGNMPDVTRPTYDVDPSRHSEIGMEVSPTGVPNIPQVGGLSLQEIYVRCIDSVVSISCSFPTGSATGTGVILSDDGYIVTNAHVVEGAANIQVILNDERVLDAVLVGADEVSDLAVLKVDVYDLIPAELGDSNVLRVGDAVVAIGDPLGISLRGTMTDGIVSGINRDITVDGRTMTLIQTTAALNEGNSGGPLINCYGQVIGINTMKIGDYMSSAGVEGLGFAIPSATVREIVEQLITQGYVSGRPDLGMEGQMVSMLHQLYGRLPQGLYITYVDPNSSAAAIGIQKGDVLISLDGIRISGPAAYEAQVFTYEVGDTAIAIIYRDGYQYEVELTVGEAGA